jgi:SAM-dependent methyltransferase
VSADPADRNRDYLDALLAGVPPSSLILDLGCGTGRPMAEYVLRQGHRVVGVDQSAALLAIARARFPQATWVRARIEDRTFGGPYFGAIAWDALFHVERRHHGPILSVIARSLPAGGRLMLTVGGSAHPPFVDTMFGREFFFDSYPPDEASELLRSVGFTILIGELMNAPTGGRDKGRYAIVAEKA